MNRLTIRGWLPLLVVATGAVLPPAARADQSLSTTAFGALDFGDRIAFHVAGAGCTTALAHVAVVAANNEIDGPDAAPVADAFNAGQCVGVATVPGFNDVAATGWQQGQPITMSLVSAAGESVPLRYARIEADEATIAAGAPTVVDANDPDTGAWDKAMSMVQGDAIGIGRVDLRHVEALSLRICLPLGVGQSTPLDPVLEERHEITTYMSVHQESPSGPALIPTIDVASDPFTGGRLDTHGFGHGCWRLLTLPVGGSLAENAPPLFVVFDTGVGNVLINSIDIDGTAAKATDPPPSDPAGMQTIFDGSSFTGWTANNCVIRDGAAASADTSQAGSGCSMTLNTPLHNVVIRYDLRRQSFFDNNAMYVGHEIQGRTAGEYGPGGYFGEDAARWEKYNMWPDWSQMEIVQLGARYVVSINGRTVTDHIASGGDPAPYQFRLQNQPEWAWQYRVGAGFGDENPVIEPITDWGRFWYRNIRVYQCASATDPVCTAAADARPGEVAKG